MNSTINDRFEVSIADRDSTYSMNMPHTHSFYEIYVVLEGRCEYIIENRTHILTANSVYMVPMNVPHQTIYYEGEKVKRLNIEFSENYLSELINHFGFKTIKENILNQHVKLPEYTNTILRKIAEFLHFECTQNNIYSDYSKRIAFEELIIFILRNRTTYYDSISNGQPVHDDGIKKALIYIDNNYQKNITLNMVAELNHLNPNYFSVKFKQATGRNFKDYVTALRISHSEKYLLETQKSITEIAFLCGFENSNYYGDVFRKIHNMSPTEFRKNKGQPH